MHRTPRIPARRRRFAPCLAALWLGSLALAAPAAALEMLPQAMFFYKLGTGTSDGPLVVTLNDEGVWADSGETERTWSLAFRVEWTTAVGMVKDFRVFAKPGWDLGSQPDVLGTQAEITYSVQPNVAEALIEQGKIAQFEATAAVASVFPYSGSSSTPAGVCQLKRNALLAGGTSLHEVLANDWTVEKEAKATAVLDYYKDYSLDTYGVAQGEDPEQVSAVVTLPLTVLCKGDKAIADAVAPLYQGSYAAGFQVTGAKLFIAPAYQNLTADCPVTVPLVAEFTATNIGSLKFRFVSASGKASPLYSAQITGQTGGIYKTLYEKQIQVPLTQAGGMGGGQSGGGGGNQQAGGGFAVQTQPEEPLFPTAPSSGGMGQVQVNPVAGNIHSESFRVEVVEPATGIVSDYAGYRITCKPTMVPGIAGAQNLQMQPQTPQPGSDGATTVIGGIATTPVPQAPSQAGQVPAAPSTAPAAAVVAGLPDLMATTLGIAVGGAYVPWGTTTTIDNPGQIVATRQGPGRDLCLVNAGGHRTFNKGQFAAGPFQNRILRDGTPVQSQQIAGLGPQQTVPFKQNNLLLKEGLNVLQAQIDFTKSVSESDENNNYTVRAIVQADCNGDGKVAGVAQPRLRTLAPAAPQTPKRVAPSRTAPQKMQVPVVPQRTQ
jgi:hypothetical protein